MEKTEHITTDHEKSDVSVPGIVLFGGALIVGTGIACLVVWGLFALLAADAAKTEPMRPPLYQGERLPPEPRLQGIPGHQNFPTADIREFRAQENAELDSYGWVVKPAGTEAGIIHIPIEQAKKLLLERGLPTPTASIRPSQSSEKKTAMR